MGSDSSIQASGFVTSDAGEPRHRWVPRPVSRRFERHYLGVLPAVGGDSWGGLKKRLPGPTLWASVLACADVPIENPGLCSSSAAINLLASTSAGVLWRWLTSGLGDGNRSAELGHCGGHQPSKLLGLVSVCLHLSLCILALKGQHLLNIFRTGEPAR